LDMSRVNPFEQLDQPVEVDSGDEKKGNKQPKDTSKAE